MPVRPVVPDMCMEPQRFADGFFQFWQALLFVPAKEKFVGESYGQNFFFSSRQGKGKGLKPFGGGILAQSLAEYVSDVLSIEERGTVRIGKRYLRKAPFVRERQGGERGKVHIGRFW